MGEPLKNAKLLGEASPRGCHFVDDGAPAQGIMFDCPNPACGHVLIVWFANPIGGGPAAPPDCAPTPRWQRTGETLATLTLTPSILVDCWHGYIRNGHAEVTP